MSKVKIYGILNPLNNMIFYIGASINPELRFEIHKNGAEWHPITHRYKQIKLLKSKKILPLLIIFEEVDRIDAKKSEQFWIDYFLAEGHRLSQNKKSGYPVNEISYGYNRYLDEQEKAKK